MRIWCPLPGLKIRDQLIFIDPRVLPWDGNNRWTHHFTYQAIASNFYRSLYFSPPSGPLKHSGHSCVNLSRISCTVISKIRLDMRMTAWTGQGGREREGTSMERGGQREDGGSLPRPWSCMLPFCYSWLHGEVKSPKVNGAFVFHFRMPFSLSPPSLSLSLYTCI